MAAGSSHGPDSGPPEVVAHGAALRSLARALVGEAAADDAVQETWLRYLLRRPGTGVGLGWLTTALRRLVSNDRRDAQRRERRERDAARPEAIDEPALRERDDTLRGVVEAVFALEPAYREVVMLRWFEGLAPREIALRLGVEPHVVHTRLSRAHSKLREKLDRDLGTRRALSGLVALAGLEGHPPAPFSPRGAERWAGGGKVAILMASKVAWVSGVVAVVLWGALWYAVSRADAGESAQLRARDEQAAQPSLLDFSDAARAGEPAPLRAEAPQPATALGRVEPAPWAEPPFDYELEVSIVDSLDLPRDNEWVRAAPAGHTLNDVGTTDSEGRLVLRWKGFQPAMELDLALQSGDGGRRMRVVAGTQRIALRTESSRAGPARGAMKLEVVSTGGAQLQILRDLPMFLGAAQGSVPCERDSEGRILWVEPALCDVPGSLSELGYLEDSVVLEGGDVEFRASVVRVAAGTPATGRLVGRVLDGEGQPVAGASVVARRAGTNHRPAARTDADGRFRLDGLAPADWTVAAGGGDFGRAQQLVTVTPGDTSEWEPRLDRGMELKGRLLGPDGAALSDWIVELESDDPLEPLCDATRTDSEGRFAIPNLPPRTLRVLARPMDRSRGFALVVATGVLPGEAELELVASLREREAKGSVSATIADIEGRDPKVLRFTAWREDTGRGTPGECAAIASQVATSTEGGVSEVSREPTELALDGLGPGWHTLEIAMRGRAPLVVPRLLCEPGQPIDLGALLAPQPATLALGGPKGSSATCQLVYRGDSVELRCEFDTAAHASLHLREGEYRITRKLGGDAVTRRLRVEAGAVAEF